MSGGEIAKKAFKVIGGIALIVGGIWFCKDAPYDVEGSGSNDDWDDYYYYNQWLWDDLFENNNEYN